VRRFLLGSVAEEVVRQAPCSVMTFHPPAEGEPRRPERILAPIDFSEHSRGVVIPARELGSVYHASVDFLHVVPEPNFPVFYELSAGSEVYANLTQLREKAAEALGELVRETPGADVAIDCHVRYGEPASEILRFAEERESDLIVIATHGLTGLSHLLLGSVAEKVLRQATCPVLVVRTMGRSLVRQPAG
jgi:nucleotide-binding universal stress UspA family protein